MFGRFNWTRRAREAARSKAWMMALDRSHAVIEFLPDGTITHANPAFLSLMGYGRDEVVGRHHSMFADPAFAASNDYARFWDSLRRGEFQQAEYMRLAKGGRPVWIQATYNPVLDRNGRVVSVVKFATDITADKTKALDITSQIAAISKSMAVIQFDLDGTILDANDNFLSTMGYGRDEVVGQKHAMFVEPNFARGAEYAAFWRDLRQGSFQAGEYERVGKGGRPVWIQATYNPILGLTGKPVKIVKFGTDVTARVVVSRAASASLDRLAHGDLTGLIEPIVPGPFEDLQKALNMSLKRIAELIGQVQQSSGLLKTATREILSGANDLAERTTRQASNIEQTTASVEQLAAAVALNAQHARGAAADAGQVSRAAQAGGDAMRQADGAMGRITASSGKISSITSLIDDIAFQTNLLALNASVEAARAGDAGKGFAVVAVEVRRLAQSAAQASKEIKGLIEQSANDVSTGSKLMGEAVSALSTMLASAQSNLSAVERIALDCQAQADSIAELKIAVGQMDEMTQHNAALVEETNAAIEQTEAQAAELDKVVAVFNLEETQAAPAHRPAGFENARGLQQKVARASRAYLSKGNAALDEWAEF